MVDNTFYNNLIVKQEIEYFGFDIYRCCCEETGMKTSPFPADSRVIFCQSSNIFTKMILLFKINDIGLKANT